MSINIPAIVYGYRIVHYMNLPFILNNGLHCSSSLQKDPNYVNIGKKDIISKRESKAITCKPYGHIHDYVSFYFGPRSPMLYVIHKGNSDTNCTQEEIIYLVTSIPKLQEQQMNFVFTNGQALMALSAQYTDIKDLDKINWNIINGKYWDDIPPNITDRKRQRQAELLVHNHVPIKCIIGIGVLNATAKSRVDKMVKNAGLSINVKILPNWYY